MRATLLAIFLCLLCAPAALAAGTGTKTTPQLSSGAPWLTQTSASTTPAPTVTATDTAATSTVTATATATTPAVAGSAPPRGNLPFTGDDLLPETLAAVLLIAAGIVIRFRWRPRW